MPHISHMRMFGCMADVKVPDKKRTKLDAKGVKCLFLGYCKGIRYTNSFSWRRRESLRIQTWCVLKTKHLLRIVQKGELAKHMRSRWTYPQIERAGVGDLQECFWGQFGAQHWGRSRGQCSSHKIHS